MNTPADGPHLFDWIELGVQAAGVVILYFYTRYTRKQLRVNQDTLAAMRESLEEARASNKATLEEMQRGNQQAMERTWFPPPKIG